MAREVKESDWRVLRALHPVALDRFCERILSEIAGTIGATGKTQHEKYLAVYRLVERGDGEIAETFNDMRRSTAFRRICSLRRLHLLTEEEFARFSDEMRSVVENASGPLRRLVGVETAVHPADEK